MTRLPPPTEAAESAALWAWVYALEGRYPDLRLIHHVPNEGKRNPRRARAEGIRAGVPDVMVPIPRGAYCGLAVELKAGRGRVSDAQDTMLAALEGVGWRTHVHRSEQPGDWTGAAVVIADYLGLPRECWPDPERQG